MRDNISSTWKLDTVAMTKALLTLKNTPDRPTGLSLAYLLLGRNLRYFLQSKPTLGSASDLSSTWREVAAYRELALAKRLAKAQENQSEHVKEYAPLEIGDCVMVENQSGNKPLR